MRKKIIICAAVALCLLVLCPLNVLAEGEYQYGTLPPEYGDFIGSVDGALGDALPDGALSDKAEDLANAASEISSPAKLIEILLSGFSNGLQSVLPTLALILCTVILTAVCRAVSNGMSAGLCQAVELITRLCSFCAISASAVSCTESLNGYFERLFAAVSSFLPLSAVLYAMGGNLTGAASSGITVGITLTVCEFICTRTVIPLFCVCLSLSLMSVFDGVGGNFGAEVSATLRKWYTTALSFVMMILTSSVAAQSIISAKADNAAMRGVKFAVSSFVPISGGTVSSTLGTLAAGVELMRGSVGVIGIFVIVLMLIPTVIELALMRAVFSLGAFCAGVLGCGGEQRLLSELDGLYGYLEGVAVLCSAVFLIAFGIFAGISASVA